MRRSLAAVLFLLLAPGLSGQEETEFWLEGPDGTRLAMIVGIHRGFVAVPVGELTSMGWRVQATARGVTATLPSTETRLELEEGTPFFTWSDTTLQLTEAPYRFSGELYIPIQVIVGFLPRRLPDRFAFDREERVLRVLPLGAGTSSDADRSADADPEAGSTREAVARESVAPEPRSDPPVRVVIIDAGHGGVDPGTTSSGGLREKDLVLSLARAVEEEMVSLPNTEVYMTRDRDVLVPIWERGERATEWRGDRPGVFISLHLNALPSSRSTRGFETYILSEARTDHERRVAALENASLELEGDAGRSVGEDDLSFILNELRNLDHQNWSAYLAERIQEEMDAVHPGPNRGVKQGPFAVITNTLMPAVLVEVGYLSNRSEARLMAREDFQRDAARAIARAVDTFFQSYPPAQAGGGQGR